MKRLLFSGALVLAAEIASGEAPPAQPFRSIDWPPTMPKQPTNGITLGKLRVQFEATTLHEVQSAIGLGQISQNLPSKESEHILLPLLHGGSPGRYRSHLDTFRS